MMMALACTIITVVQARLSFESVSALGDYYQPKAPARRDPFATIAWGSFVLANANGSTFSSSDGGHTWQRQTWGSPRLAQHVPVSAETVMSYDSGAAAYVTNATTSLSIHEYVVWTVDKASRTFQRTVHSAPDARVISFTGLPFKSYEFALSAGGTAVLADGTFVASTTLWGAHNEQSSELPRLGEMPGPCCNNSVGIFTSRDGFNWKFASVVAHKADVAGSQEGPNESTLAILKDGRLIVIFRVDGGDGKPDQTHKPYMMAISQDQGHSWSKPVSLPAGVMSAKPMAVVLADGTLLLSGGRPALNVWESPDGLGQTWISHDIPTEHNQLVGEASSLRFCDAFANATLSLGWAESSGYTTLVSTSSDASTATGLVCYERQGGHSGGYHKKNPPQCNPSFSSIFCMSMRVWT